MSGSPATVFVIVVNYNGWPDTLECMESVLRSDYLELRVVVCDNASTDESVQRIRAWASGSLAAARGPGELSTLSSKLLEKPVRVQEVHASEITEGGPPMSAPIALVHCGANLGFAGANNVGLRLAQANGAGYALLFNNDAVMAPGAIGAMVEAAAGLPRCGAMGATILRYDRPDRVETLGGARVGQATGLVQRVEEDLLRTAARPATVALDYVTGCCMLVPLNAVRRVGLMAEHYFLYGEDTDWCLRMRHAGYGMAYAPNAEVWHKGGGSVVHRSATHDYYAVRGTLMLMHRHYRATLPLVLVHAVLRFLLPKLVRGQWRRLGAAARGYRDFLRHAAGRPVPLAPR